jgi:hypothetical protein
MLVVSTTADLFAFGLTAVRDLPGGGGVLPPSLDVRARGGPGRHDRLGDGHGHRRCGMARLPSRSARSIFLAMMSVSEIDNGAMSALCRRIRVITNERDAPRVSQNPCSRGICLTIGDQA